MSFSWFQAFIYPFVVFAKGQFAHDTIAMVIPPRSQMPPEGYIDVSYVPSRDRKALIIGLKFGKARQFDSETGTIGQEIIATDIGVWHATPGYMVWHWDPFVESIIELPVYPQAFFVSTEKPYILRIVNNRDIYVWGDATFYYIEFPKTIYCPLYGSCDPEELFYKYMSGVVALFVAANHVGVNKLVELLGGGR